MYKSKLIAYNLKHTFLFAVSIFLLGTTVTYAQNEFITVWKTDIPGGGTNSSGNEQIYFPGIGDGYTIVWEKLDASGNVTHTGTINNVRSFTPRSYDPVTYDPIPLTQAFLLDFRTVGGVHSNTGAGTYRIKVSPGSGTFTGFTLTDFEDPDNNPIQGKVDAKKLIDVAQWGTIAWTHLEQAFYKASNMKMSATLAPNLTGVTSMLRMFKMASSFNSNINHWDVSNVTNMFQVVSGATSFNQPLNNWNVSNVTNMYGIFSGATSFNQPLDNWNVGKVTNIELGFANTPSFNQPLHTWVFAPGTVSVNVWFGKSGMTMATWDKTFIGWYNSTPGNVNVSLQHTHEAPYCVAYPQQYPPTGTGSSAVSLVGFTRSYCPNLTTPSGTNRRPAISSVSTLEPYYVTNYGYPLSVSNYGQDVTFRVTDASGTVVHTEVRPASNAQLGFTYTPTTDLAFGQYKAEIVTTHFGNEYTLAESTGTILGGAVTTTPPTCTTAGTSSITNYNATASYAFNPNTSGITINPTTGLISGLTLGQSYTVTVTQGGTSVTSDPFVNQPSIQSTLPTPTGSTTQTFCTTDNPTVANLAVATGINVQWYNNATGTGTALASTTALTNNTTYYGFSTSGSCKSANKLTVEVMLTAEPNTNTVSVSGDDVCGGATVVFTINGTANDKVSYKLNGGTETVATIGAGGTVPVTVANATSSQTIVLTKLANANCEVALSNVSHTISIISAPSITIRDERIELCKLPSRNINLNNYIAHILKTGQTIQWKKDSTPLADPTGQTFNTATLIGDTVTKYEYTVTETTTCGTATKSAYLYIKAFEKKQQLFEDKDFECCESDATNLNLHQILGQQATGTWEFITPTGLTPTQINTYLTNGHYFNGKQAFADGIGVDVNTGKGVYKFKFTVTATSTGCLTTGSTAIIRIVVEPDS